MPSPEQQNAAERRSLRSRVNQMQRAISAVHLSIEGLGQRDRLIVLNEVLTDELRAARTGESMRGRTACRVVGFARSNSSTGAPDRSPS